MKRIPKIITLSVLTLCLTSFFAHECATQSYIDAETSANATTVQEASSEQTSEKETLKAITKLTLNRSTLTLTKGKKSALTVEIVYSNNTGSDIPKEATDWVSKDTSIATVSKTGIVKAVGSGQTYIICSSKSGTVKARCKVIVKEPYNSIKSLSIDKSVIRLNRKDKRTLTPIIKYKTKKYSSNEAIVWSSSNNKVAAVNKKGVVTGKKNGTTYIKVKSKYSGKTAKCKVIVQKTKYIAFTFDDGPGIYTDKLLDALSKYHSQATFFILGNRASAYKTQLKREYNLGMEIGSHTYSHKNLKLLSKKSIRSEILKTNNAVKKVTGAKPTLLRPPYGNYNSNVSKKAGVPMIYWTVDTEDWKLKNKNKVFRAISNSSKDGDIVLLHDIHETSVDGFIKALPLLRKHGFELVTVSELYKIKGTKLKKGVMHFGPRNDK